MQTFPVIHANLFSFSAISQRWESTGSSNPSSRKTGKRVSYVVIIMAAVGLATEGAKASAAMVQYIDWCLPDYSSLSTRRVLFESF